MTKQIHTKEHITEEEQSSSQEVQPIQDALALLADKIDELTSQVTAQDKRIKHLESQTHTNRAPAPDMVDHIASVTIARINEQLGTSGMPARGDDV